MTRIPIRLTDEILAALRTFAKQEHRDVRQQAAWIIEQELGRRGLLVIETQDIANPVEDAKYEQGGAYVADQHN